MSKMLDPIPPGEILLEEFLRPLGISQNRLASDIDVPVSRIAGIVKGDRAITAGTALRLGEYFGTAPEIWTNLQAGYENAACPPKLLAGGQSADQGASCRLRPLACSVEGMDHERRVLSRCGAEHLGHFHDEARPDLEIAAVAR